MNLTGDPSRSALEIPAGAGVCDQIPGGVGRSLGALARGRLLGPLSCIALWCEVSSTYGQVDKGMRWDFLM